MIDSSEFCFVRGARAGYDMKPRRRTSAPHQGQDSRSSAPHCRRAARSARFRTHLRGRVEGTSRRFLAKELHFRHYMKIAGKPSDHHLKSYDIPK